MRKTLICIGGFPASGKTTLGQQLQKDLAKVQIIDPDHAWLTILGKDPQKDLLKDADIDVSKAADVIAYMLSETKKALKSDAQHILVPSAFILGSMRQQYEELANEFDLDFKAVWLDADVITRKKRADKRAVTKTTGNKRGFNASAVSGDKVTEAKIDGALTWSRIDASGNFAATYKAVYRALFAAQPPSQAGNILQKPETHKI